MMNSDEQLISVIIPVYNVEDYVERCVKSVLAQSYENMEIILVDDGSTDHSGMICDQLKEKDPRIRVIHKKNGGLSEARNTALDVAKGEFVFFIDSDDCLTGDFFNKIYSLCKAEKADIVCFGYKDALTSYYLDEEHKILTGREAAIKMFLNDGLDANAVCKLYRRDLFEGIRYPVGKVYEVVPVTYRVLMRAEKVVQTNICGYYIETRNNSITRQKFSDKNLQFTDQAYDVYQSLRGIDDELAFYAYQFYLYAIICMTEKAIILGNKKEDCYRTMYSLFQDSYPAIKKSRYLQRRKKQIALLIKTGCYGVVWRAYNWVKMRKQKKIEQYG